MGNNKSTAHSHDHHGHGHGHSRSTGHGQHQPNEQVMNMFLAASGGQEELTLSMLQEKLGEFAVPVYLYLNDGDAETSMKVEQFAKHAQSLIGSSKDIYIKILGNATEVLKACFDSAHMSSVDTESSFFKLVLEDMTSKGDTVDAIIAWKQVTCPALCLGLQEQILDLFFNRHHEQKNLHSDILSPAQMYFVQAMLPRTVYFAQSQDANRSSLNAPWVLLYSSEYQGISINQFENKAFHYSGATVVLFRKTDNSTFIIANDQEWRHSTKKFGGNNSLLIELFPKFQRIDTPESIYCNFKLRSSMFGLTFGRHFALSDDMSDLAAIEVWGCADENVLMEQQKQKLRIKRAAEQKGTVPMPGNWDENPDKSIMEMAGFQFSTERRDDRPPDER